MSRARCHHQIHPDLSPGTGVAPLQCSRRDEHRGLHRAWLTPLPPGWDTPCVVTISGDPAFAREVAISWGDEP